MTVISAFRAVAATAAVLLLTGCFLPSAFEASMQVSPDGRFSFQYEGYLTQLQLLQRIGKGELEGDQIQEYAEIYANEMKRDKGFKEVTYISQAKYRVRYSKQGNLARVRQFSFPSRRGKLMAIKLNEQGYMQVVGGAVPANIKGELKAKGFKLWGKVKIWTAAKVVSDNADSKSRQGNMGLYEWDIRTMDHPTPQMLIVPKS